MLTELGKAARLDAETVSYCLALLRFRANGIQANLHRSPKADALREAADELGRMLLAKEPCP